MKNLKTVQLLAAALLAVISPALAQDVVIPTARTPLESVLAAQMEREAATVERLSIALNDGLPLEERQQALSELGGVEFDYVLANGEALVTAAAPLATQIALIIGAEIAMLPTHQRYDGHGDGARDPLSKYHQGLVARSEELLGLALKHESPEVRLQASTIVASRGDVAALSTIDALIAEGEIDARLGVGYMSLAPSQIAAPFVARYAFEGSEEVKAAALSQLAYNPSYLDQVLAVALNPNSSPLVVSAALPGLAITDASFLEYGPALAGDSQFSTVVRETALRESLGVLFGGPGSLTPIENYVANTLRDSSIELNTESASEAYRSFETLLPPT